MDKDKDKDKKEIKRQIYGTARFNLNDTYFLDDDVPYSAFNGKEAEEIIIPCEENTDGEISVKNILLTDENGTDDSTVTVKKKSGIDFISAVYYTEDAVERVGEQTIALFLYIINKISPAFIIPYILISDTLKALFKKIRQAPKKIHLSITDDIRRIFLELKAIINAAKAVEKKKTFVFARAMLRYFIMSFNRHRHFWKTLFNIALPVATAFAVILIFGNAMKGSTFALEVIYNGQSLGYVEDSATFEEGKAQAMALLSSGEDDSSAEIFTKPVYKLSRVNVNKLSNSQMISEGIISGSDESYVRACGIYIDGEFICAVKNESDAVSVFSQLLKPYEENAEEGTIVSFVEEIDYIQGYYKENSTHIWDTATLQDMLNKPKSEKVIHKMKKSDTVASVAKQYELTRKQLRAMNPGVDFTKPKKIKSLLVAEEENYVRVKVMKTRTRTVSIPYETIERESSSLSKGTKKTTQNGSYGQKVITELVTYINGELSYTSFVSEKQTKAPVNKIVLVGTKTTSSPVYSSSVTSRGFTWPTRGAYNISSYYGYRSASISGWSFHGGIDIIRYGGSSGIPVVASASGTVVSAYSGWSGYGHTVLINHGNGIMTRYAHMQPGSICVRAGQYVYQGQQIGRIGSTGNSTGPHLHFEVLVNGVKVNPLGYIR